MKLIRSGKEKFQFEIGREEKGLLLHVLRLYPLVPAEHHQLSKGRRLPNREENQHLLEESLAAQRQENRRHVEALLNDPKRFSEKADDSRVSFSRTEIEWLLQVLNDVRIGSWLALGSPAEQLEIQIGTSKQAAQYILAMDVAGYFQMNFLSAVSGAPPGHD